MHDLASGFLPLPGIDPSLANHWGSFPSDHAALLFALVTVIWQRSRWLGLLALVSALYGVLPRIYFGLHYVSDVTAGALLGVAFVLLFERFGPRTWAHRGVGWEQRLPGMFYGVAFLVSLEVATLFEDIRQVGRGIPAVLKQLGIGVMS
jgi:undecaprenyl-diphosphatase